MAGRHKLPTNLKLLQGTMKPSRFNPNEPVPETEIPDCPPELSLMAKKEWLRITPLLEELGLVAKINRSSLAQYCVAYARWIKAEQMITKHGEVIMIVKEVRRGKMGSPKDDKPGEVVADKIYCVAKESPWLKISLKWSQECRKFASEFGMTPSSMGRVTPMSDPKKKDDNKPKDKNRFFK
jgi:P27 family predicted phage terminase small subunit